LWRQSNDLDALANEHATKCIAVFRIPIKNQVLLSAKETVIQVGKITRDLHHPLAVGMGRDSCDIHRAAADVDEEQDVVCYQSPLVVLNSMI